MFWTEWLLMVGILNVMTCILELSYPHMFRHPFSIPSTKIYGLFKSEAEVFCGDALCMFTYFNFTSHRRFTDTVATSRAHPTILYISPLWHCDWWVSHLRIRSPNHLKNIIVRFDSPNFPPELPRRWYVAAVYVSESWSGCFFPAKNLWTCNSWDLRDLRVSFMPNVTISHSCCCTVHIVNYLIVYQLMHIHTIF